MTSSRTALVCSVLAVVLWAAKATAIGIAGGLGRSPAEGPLFLLGLLAAVVAAVSLGFALTTGRHLAVRLSAALVSLLLMSALGALVQLAVVALQPSRPGWVWGEINLWVNAVVLLLATLGLVRRPSRVETQRGRATTLSEAR